MTGYLTRFTLSKCHSGQTLSYPHKKYLLAKSLLGR
jgi:hypothetical protein